LSENEKDVDAQQRMAATVRLIVTRRERAPRSPQMERVLKRLIWRYTAKSQEEEEHTDAQE